MSVRGDHRRRPSRPTLLPLRLAGQELNAKRSAAVFRVPVEIIADEDDPAVLVRQRLVQGVDLLDLDAPVRVGKLAKQRPAFAVTCREKNQVAANDRRGDHGGGPEILQGPEKLAVAGPDAKAKALTRLDVNARLADLRDHDRGVAGPRVARHDRCPDRLAVLLVQGGHRGLAARRADDLVAVDQDRLAVTPAIAFCAPEVLLHVLAPALLAARRFHADQIAVARQHVEQFAVNRGSGARAFPLLVPVFVRLPDLRLPERLAGGVVEAEEVFVAAFRDRGRIAHGEDLAGRHRHAGIAAAGPLGLPQQGRTSLPFLEQSRFRGHAVAIGAAPLRPVGGVRKGRADDQGNERTNPDHKTPPRKRRPAPETSVFSPGNIIRAAKAGCKR